jgi:protein phosphatase
MREYSDPAQCVERLIQLALRGGGPDNITVIIADVTDGGDIREQRPMVGGAAARDRGMAPTVEGSTPASRASALNAPRVAAPEPPPDEDSAGPRRHPLRTTALLVLLLAILGGLLWGGWAWSQSQYYVGATPDGTVAVYQGIPGQIAGVHLSKVHQSSNVRVGDLTKVAQDKVKQGITANSEADARRTLADLINPANGNVVPNCPSPSASVSDSASPSPASAGPLTASPTVPAGSPTASPSVEPTGSGSPSPMPSLSSGC